MKLSCLFLIKFLLVTPLMRHGITLWSDSLHTSRVSSVVLWNVSDVPVNFNFTHLLLDSKPVSCIINSHARHIWFSIQHISFISYLSFLNNWELIWKLVLHVVSLVGQSAPPEFLQKLTYLVLRHDPVIRHVDTVRAYTFGVLYFVEVSLL